MTYAQPKANNVRHHILLEKVAKRVDDAEIMRLLKLILKATGKRGVPQGGVISPLLSNIYLNEVDKMLEEAKETTRKDNYTQLEYARFADDLIVLINWHPSNNWLSSNPLSSINCQLSTIPPRRRMPALLQPLSCLRGDPGEGNAQPGRRGSTGP